MIEKTTKIAGAVTYWTLAEWTDVNNIGSAFTILGLNKFSPQPPTPLVACKRALVEVFGDRNTLVRPLGDDKYAVVREKRVEGDDLDYDVEFKVQATKNDQPLVDPAGHPGALPFQEAYTQFRSKVPSGAVGSALAQLARHLGGVRLRESGGVFWLPEDSLETWRKLANACASASVQGSTLVYVLRTAIDDSAVKAVHDAITKDIQDSAKEIREKSRDQTNVKALERRKDEANALNQRIAAFEAILGHSLDTLRDQAKQAEREAAMAVMAAMGGE